jgi:hypothetical protein
VFATTTSHDRSLLRWIGIALYATVLVLASFEHHDLVCHLKNPQHCTACTASQLGTDPATYATPAAWHLADAGCATAFQPLSQGVLLPDLSTGRSPPTSV